MLILLLRVDHDAHALVRFRYYLDPFPASSILFNVDTDHETSRLRVVLDEQVVDTADFLLIGIVVRGGSRIGCALLSLSAGRPSCLPRLWCHQ
jgi:hypothetical protein